MEDNTVREPKVLVFPAARHPLPTVANRRGPSIVLQVHRHTRIRLRRALGGL